MASGAGSMSSNPSSFSSSVVGSSSNMMRRKDQVSASGPWLLAALLRQNSSSAPRSPRAASSNCSLAATNSCSVTTCLISMCAVGGACCCSCPGLTGVAVLVTLASFPPKPMCTATGRLCHAGTFLNGLGGPFVDEVERSDAKSPAPLAATTSGNSHVSSAYSDTLPSNPAVTNTPGVRGLQSTLKFQLPLCGSSASTSKSDEVSHTMVLLSLALDSRKVGSCGHQDSASTPPLWPRRVCLGTFLLRRSHSCTSGLASLSLPTASVHGSNGLHVSALTRCGPVGLRNVDTGRGFSLPRSQSTLMPLDNPIARIFPNRGFHASGPTSGRWPPPACCPIPPPTLKLAGFDRSVRSQTKHSPSVPPDAKRFWLFGFQSRPRIAPSWPARVATKASGTSSAPC
mmetsp:Transcript_14518/g.43874  ORF Transcript_14518/g.43874 Transcript_14518/m.43874 type:complete len:399 (+) Transcript_14518:1310-2506(+)